MLVANLKNGMTITGTQLENILSELKIKVIMFIDGETKSEFISKTGFTFDHNYNNNETYTISQW